MVLDGVRHPAPRRGLRGRGRARDRRPPGEEAGDRRRPDRGGRGQHRDHGRRRGRRPAGAATVAPPAARPRAATAAASGSGAGGPNQASDVGVTADQIVIGNITAENGVLGDAFAPAAAGMRAWAAAINAKGGIHGRQVVLKTCDDGESRNKTLECAKRLVEQDKVVRHRRRQHPGDGRRRAVPERQGRAGDRHADHQRLLPLPALLQRLRVGLRPRRQDRGQQRQAHVHHRDLPVVQAEPEASRRRRCSTTTSPSRSRPATPSPRA